MELRKHNKYPFFECWWFSDFVPPPRPATLQQKGASYAPVDDENFETLLSKIYKVFFFFLEIEWKNIL